MNQTRFLADVIKDDTALQMLLKMTYKRWRGRNNMGYLVMGVRRLRDLIYSEIFEGSLRPPSAIISEVR